MKMKWDNTCAVFSILSGTCANTEIHLNSLAIFLIQSRDDRDTEDPVPKNMWTVQMLNWSEQASN